MQLAILNARASRGHARRWLRLAPLLLGALASVSFVACGDETADNGTDDGTATVTTTATSAPATGTATEPAATATTTPTTTSTATATATAGGNSSEDGPPAPTNVHLSGRLPDTSATVPPGEGEAGRVTIEWDAPVDAVEGFLVYQRDCDGSTIAGDPIEVAADERQYGPLQPCRPGGDIGVSAVSETGESEIVWAQGSTSPS